MSTQEKLEQKIFNLVYQWGRVGIVADHTAPTYVAYIQELIDSATREAVTKELEHILGGTNSILRYETVELATTLEEAEKLTGENDTIYAKPLKDYLERRIAQLQEQSGGEKNE